MSILSFYALLLFGIVKILVAIINAGQHGQPKNEKYDARIEVCEALVGVWLILLAFGVI
jgi:hypothetical protein